MLGEDVIHFRQRSHDSLLLPPCRKSSRKYRQKRRKWCAGSRSYRCQCCLDGKTAG